MSQYTTPKLPDGYFFRVGPEEGFFMRYAFGVSLRKKTWYGSKIISRSLPLGANAETVSAEMHYLKKGADLEGKVASDIKARIEKLSGDYPPKEFKVQ